MHNVSIVSVVNLDYLPLRLYECSGDMTITIRILFLCLHLPIGVSKSSEKGIEETGKESSLSTAPFH